MTVMGDFCLYVLLTLLPVAFAFIIGYDRGRRSARHDIEEEQEMVRKCLRALEKAQQALAIAGKEMGLDMPPPPQIPLVYCGKPVFPETGSQ